MTDTLWSQPHRDGSTTYVSNPTPKLGSKITMFLRVLHASDVTNAWVRVLCDGEPEPVYAARAHHPTVRIPASAVGSHLTGLAESSDLRANTDSMVILPSKGPAFGMWRLSDI